jgi:hypothetical protein
MGSRIEKMSRDEKNFLGTQAYSRPGALRNGTARKAVQSDGGVPQGPYVKVSILPWRDAKADDSPLDSQFHAALRPGADWRGFTQSVVGNGKAGEAPVEPGARSVDLRTNFLTQSFERQ